MSVDGIVSVLAAHQLRGSRCTCGAFVAGGARLDGRFDHDVRNQQAAHQAQAVLAHLRAVAADEGVREQCWKATATAARRHGDEIDAALAAFLGALMGGAE